MNSVKKIYTDRCQFLVYSPVGVKLAMIPDKGVEKIDINGFLKAAASYG